MNQQQQQQTKKKNKILHDIVQNIITITKITKLCIAHLYIQQQQQQNIEEKKITNLS